MVILSLSTINLSEKKEYKTSVTLPTPSRTGYEFAGWYKERLFIYKKDNVNNWVAIQYLFKSQREWQQPVPPLFILSILYLL